MSILDTGIKNVRNVLGYNIGADAINSLEDLLAPLRSDDQPVVAYIDEFFSVRPEIVSKLKLREADKIIFVSTDLEPTTDYIDQRVAELHKLGIHSPSAIIGMGGGITLDVGKAVSNMLTNDGSAADYQGWDLLKKPAIFLITNADGCVLPFT